MSGDDARRELEAEAWERARSWSLNSGPIEDGDPTAELVQQLRAVGVPLQSLGEFSNVPLTYQGTIPILLDHLRKPYSDNIKGAILQILSFATPNETVHNALISALREQLEDASDDMLFAFGEAIAKTAPKHSIESLLAIASAPHFRTARMSPMLKIARNKDPRVRQAIADYLIERDVNPWLAIRALRLAKMWDHAEWVAPYMTSPNEYYRPEARKFQRAFEKDTGHKTV